MRLKHYIPPELASRSRGMVDYFYHYCMIVTSPSSCVLWDLALNSFPQTERMYIPVQYLKSQTRVPPASIHTKCVISEITRLQYKLNVTLLNCVLSLSKAWCKRQAKTFNYLLGGLRAHICSITKALLKYLTQL